MENTNWGDSSPDSSSGNEDLYEGGDEDDENQKLMKN